LVLGIATGNQELFYPIASTILVLVVTKLILKIADDDDDDDDEHHGHNKHNNNSNAVNAQEVQLANKYERKDDSERSRSNKVYPISDVQEFQPPMED
jgi:hypothetical protein